MFRKHKIRNINPEHEVKITMNGQTMGYLAVKSIIIEPAKNADEIFEKFIKKESDACHIPVK